MGKVLIYRQSKVGELNMKQMLEHTSQPIHIQMVINHK